MKKKKNNNLVLTTHTSKLGVKVAINLVQVKLYDKSRHNKFTYKVYKSCQAKYSLSLFRHLNSNLIYLLFGLSKQ